MESPSSSGRFFGFKHDSKRHNNHKDDEDNQFARSTTSLLARSGSRRSHTPTPSMQRSVSRRASDNFFTRSMTRRSKTPQPGPPPSMEIPTLSKIAGRNGMQVTEPSSVSRSTSRSTSRRSTTPIIFSQSSSAAKKKPAPVEKKLECTLEELCFGAVKKFTITRDVINEEGIIVEEEETLKINVKPGWRKGTQITFEGKGDEKPGFLPADIVVVIEEKKHHVYRRIGDDIELCVEVPLMKALTGCSVTLPLLGGERMNLRLEEVIYHGYEKIIEGQGVYKTNNNSSGDVDEMRGDLRLKFMVKFPDQLGEEQRTEISEILRECTDWNA